MSNRWRHYLDGNPAYLARNYWWAYLSPLGAWFFSHRFIVNLILYGRYRHILAALCSRLDTAPCGRMLQISCAYGDITPTLAAYTGELHQNDVALLQLKLSRQNLAQHQHSALLTRMNAESLGYASNSFDTVVIFFLLHELPADARQRVLGEAMRVLRQGGRLLVADYAPMHGKHFLHNDLWVRLVEWMEPFLHDFWHSNLAAQITEQALAHGKPVVLAGTSWIFNNFYRVEEYRA